MPAAEAPEEPPLPEPPPGFEGSSPMVGGGESLIEPDISRSAPQDSTVIATEPVAPEPVNGPAPATDVLGWSELAPRLQLDSMARQVALNCIVESHEDDRLMLALLPEMDVLIKPVIRDNIRKAIEAELGVSLQLEFTTRNSLPCETPAQAEARRAEQKRREVLEDIRRDSVVRELQQYFGAELDETSLRRVDDND